MIQRKRLGLFTTLLAVSCVTISCSKTANPVAASLSSNKQSVAGLNNGPGAASDADVGKMLYKFNVIATPKGDWVVPDGECTNNGHRIFFQRGSGNTLGTIDWSLVPGANPAFQITDCDGTSDGNAAIVADESQAFFVMVRLLGPKTSTLTLTCQATFDLLGDPLCLVDTVNLKRNSMTKIMQNIVDNELEDVTWTFSGDWRIFEVRIYEKLS